MASQDTVKIQSAGELDELEDLRISGNIVRKLGYMRIIL